MLNIKRAEYTIRFLTEADFREEPEIAIFKSVFKRIRHILCVNTEGKCITCSHSNKCLYNYISAGDFMNLDIMPIIIKKPLVSKNYFKEESRLNLEFMFLGDSAQHLNFVDFILKEFEVKGLFKEKYRFVIERKNLHDICADVTNGLINGIQILTPIDQNNNIFSYEKEKMERLNKLYNVTDETLELIEEPYQTGFIEFNVKRPIYLGANRIKVNGFVGKLRFDKPIDETPLLAMMKIIGAGKYYGIGGGSVILM